MKQKKVQGYRAASLALAVVLCLSCTMVANIGGTAHAADVPLGICYEYSDDVTVGTVRYVQQNQGADYYYAEYWGEHAQNSSWMCYSAVISMALSYIGVDRTAGDIAFGGDNHMIPVDSFDSAMESYENGAGKYSPVVIHFTSYPSSGGEHWVLVVRNVSGNEYEILDPWNPGSPLKTITISGSSATFDYNGSTYTKPIEVRQFYNPDAVLPSRLPAGVTSTSLLLEVTKTKTKKASNIGAGVSIPFFGKRSTTVTTATTVCCRSGPASSYEIVSRLKTGDTVEAIGYIKNSSGNLWYYLEDESYIYSGNVGVKECRSTATISQVAAPTGTLTQGNVFILKGVITGNADALLSVTATVRTEAGEVVLSETDTVNGTYSIQGSKLDNAMTFNTLAAGNYVYEVSVKESVDDGTKCVSIDTVLYTGKFNVA